MNISAFSPASIWNAVTRTLTALSTNVITTVTINNHVALANGVNVDLRPSANIFRESTIMGEPLANVTWTVQSFDGTTARNIISGGSGVGIIQPGTTTSAMGFALLNSGTVSGNFSHTGLDWHQ